MFKIITLPASASILQRSQFLLMVAHFIITKIKKRAQFRFRHKTFSVRRFVAK